MEVEKTGTTYKCTNCNHKWNWKDTHCPNCGSDDFGEHEISLDDNWRERGGNSDTDSGKFDIQRAINWALYPKHKTPHDGKYLCYVEQQQECGNIWKYQKVIDNVMNEWTLEDKEVVVAWAHLPSPPCL